MKTVRAILVAGALATLIGQADVVRADSTPPRRLLESTTAAGQYLARVVNDNGRFIYVLDPRSGYSAATDYSLLRHIGAVYAMMEAYQVAPDPRLLAAAQRSIGYMLRFAKPLQYMGRDMVCIVEDTDAKIGGNGLALVALSEYTTVTGDRQFLPLMRKLAEFPLAVQDEQGQFTVHTMEFDTQRNTHFVSSYYEGEAILGLLRLYRHDPDPRWLDAAERSARWIIHVRDDGATIDSIVRDHWLSYALNELHRLRPGDDLLIQARRIAEAMIADQVREADDPKWIGGFHRPPHVGGAATKIEGLTSLYALLRDYPSPGDENLKRQMLETIDLGVQWLLSWQYEAKDDPTVSGGGIHIGGFAHSVTNPTIRIDNVQHSLSGILAYWRILEHGSTAAPGPFWNQPPPIRPTTGLPDVTGRLLILSATAIVGGTLSYFIMLARWRKRRQHREATGTDARV